MADASQTPALAVCGWSGSGKTTLLEALIPILRDRGLRIAVVKHDAHGVDVDRPGKDSDRLFRAGADVLLSSPGESLARWQPESSVGLEEAVRQLTSFHDLVLVEGHKSTALPKIWLRREGGSGPAAGVDHVLDVLPFGAHRVERALEVALEFVSRTWRTRRRMGGVLVGGRSRRMGVPKQLLTSRGRTLVEIAVAAISNHVDEVVLLGSGEVPHALAGHRVLPDPPGVHGPMAGLLAALRWAPDAAWLTASCDLPHVAEDGAAWLLDQRRPGRWAILPRSTDGVVEPLFAVYEPQVLTALERLATDGRMAPRRLTEVIDVFSPTPPSALLPQWRGINTLDDYRRLCDERDRDEWRRR